MGGDRRDNGRAYQLQPPNALVVPQTPSEVKTIHECENEGKWVFLSRINANERHETLATVVETAACQCFLVQPLPVAFSE